jgi:DHA1 family tetracycline resistance protein-like MFS transporter
MVDNAPASENSMPKGHAHALTFILITVAVDAFGFGMTLPVLPRLVVTLTASPIADAATYGAVLAGVYAAFQFFCAPLVGRLSDRLGRRLVLFACLAAYGVDYLVMCFAPSFWWLLAGRAVAGICGAGVVVASSYVADFSSSETRLRWFGHLGAAYLLGLSLGPAFSGFLADVHLRAPFAVSAALAFGNLIVGTFTLPESLPRSRRRSFSFAAGNPIVTLLELSRYPVLRWLFVAVVFYRFAYEANSSTWVYYTLQQFHWSAIQVGLSIAALTCLVACAQAFLTGPAATRFGAERALCLGMGLYALGFAGFALAKSQVAFYLCFLPFALGGIAYPTLNGIASRQLPANMQGALQGTIASLQSLTSVLAPLAMSYVFRRFSDVSSPHFFPGAAFLLASALTIMAAMAGALAMRPEVASPPR